eukprot:TRINITY_DN34303_c0_g1_i1.p1 TRINITY_DN34303_c0_g1~~TRINITY_DN34303_c0_g1_i1.p1  ORF type:complete len:470 (+),score=201.81 TRINITY_DN34303_c0_g1_i1:254-1663(+)
MSILLRALCAVKEKKGFRNAKAAKDSPADGSLRRCNSSSSWASSAGVTNSSFGEDGKWSTEIFPVGEEGGPGPLDPATCKRLHRTLDEFDEEIRHYNPFHGGRAPVLAQHDVHLLTLVYNHMMYCYDSPKWCERDNGGRSGSSATIPGAGTHVPNYFANVHDQTIHRRKVLSMAGLRNLVVYGAEVYDELRDHLFSSDPSAYGSHEGVHKMRHFTGNMVDLDTTVLRANDRTTLATVNQMNEKCDETVFTSCKEFGNSKQAAAIAKVAASELLMRFCNEFRLTKSQARKRKCEASDLPSSIPIARSNSDRGKHPIWRYCNAGQDSFHVNVPHVDDVVGALLRAPFRAAQIYLRIFLDIEAGEAREEALEHFFSDCIADACFNQKWKAIEDYANREQQKGGIVSILQEIQKEHQQQFMEIMDDDDDDYTKEKDLMWSLVSGRSGRDKDNTCRPITKEDVAAWVDDASVVI